MDSAAHLSGFRKGSRSSSGKPSLRLMDADARVGQETASAHDQQAFAVASKMREPRELPRCAGSASMATWVFHMSPAAARSQRNRNAQEGCWNGGGILAGALVLAVEESL